MHEREGSGGIFYAHFGEKITCKFCVPSNVQIAVVLLVLDQGPIPAASIKLIYILRSGLTTRLYLPEYRHIKLLRLKEVVKSRTHKLTRVTSPQISSFH
jgi:hypothetical protein